MKNSKLQKLWCFSVLIMILMSSFAFAEDDEFIRTVYVCTAGDKLLLRAEPSKNSRVTWKFRAGEEIDIVDIKGNWARVKRDDDGWVNTCFITTILPSDSSVGPAKVTIDTIISDYPGSESGKKLKQGVEVEVLQEGYLDSSYHSWTKITYDDTVGYVLAELLVTEESFFAVEDD